jgi:hypothetical protein
MKTSIGIAAAKSFPKREPASLFFPPAAIFTDLLAAASTVVFATETK